MSLSLNIKRTFLSFAQQLFRDVPSRYTWNVDPRLTKIYIGDKFSAISGTNEKYPAIIVAARPKHWARTSIDQRLKFQGFGVDNLSKVRTDLVVGAISYQCISPNGVEAELVADVLFDNLVAYKDRFRSNDIHQLLDIQMDEEQPIRIDNVGRAFMVSVTVYYATQSTVSTVAASYELRVYTDDFGSSYLQTIIGQTSSDDYYLTYSVSGMDVIFTNPLLSGLTVYAKYLDGITLEDKIETLGTGNGLRTVYSLTGYPYEFYNILQHVDITYNVTIS